MREPRLFGATLIVAACGPAAFAIYALASDILRHTRVLGSNPVKEGEHFLGDWTLCFLVATLSLTPLRQLLGWNWLAKHRRTLGLFAFAYATMHWLTYLLLDAQLDLHDISRDLVKRSYIIVGMAALLLLLPLALTSTQGMIRRLGGKAWSRLHKLVYVACILGVTHYWMSVKADIRGPLTYASIFAVLFAYRLWRWRRDRPNAAAA